MEKTYPKWQYVFAAALWALTCGLLLWLHFGVYGRMLFPGFAFWLLLFGAVPSWAVHMGETPPLTRTGWRKRAWEAGSFLAVTLLLFCVVIEATRRPLSLSTVWLGVLLLIGVVWMLLRRFDGNAPMAVAAIYAAVLAMTLLYLAVVRPVSKQAAEDAVRERGYEVVEYRAEGNSMPPDEPLTRYEDNQGYYWFRVQKGERYGLCAVSVVDGRITEDWF